MSEHSGAAKVLFELEKTASRLFVSGDIDQMCEYLAEDVMLLNPGAELLVGRDYERAALIEASAMEGLEMTFEPKHADISSAGDMGFVYGEVVTKLPGAEAQKEKYVTVWKKTDDRWEVVLQARNSIA